MITSQTLPKDIKDEVQIYLAPEEKIMSSLSAINENVKDSGVVWLILTNKSIFFHTKEANKESVVALLPRSNVKVIEYFQKKTEIVLTFIPLSNPKNTTIISFPVKRKELLESFCEDLADLIEFKKETNDGVKTYPRVEASKAKNEAKTEKSEAKRYEPIAKANKEKVTKEVKLSKPSDKKLESLPEDYVPTAKYVILATFASIVVAFIWYQFFKLISRSGR